MNKSPTTPWNTTSFKENCDKQRKSCQNCCKSDVQPEAIDQPKVSSDMCGRSILGNLNKIGVEDRLLLLLSWFRALSSTEIHLQQ